MIFFVTFDVPILGCLNEIYFFFFSYKANEEENFWQYVFFLTKMNNKLITVSWNNIFNIYTFIYTVIRSEKGERQIGYVDIGNIDLTKSLSGRRAERSRFSLLVERTLLSLNK